MKHKPADSEEGWEYVEGKLREVEDLLKNKGMSILKCKRSLFAIDLQRIKEYFIYRNSTLSHTQTVMHTVAHTHADKFTYVYLFPTFFACSSRYVVDAKELTIMLQKSLSPSAAIKGGVFHPKTGDLGDTGCSNKLRK